MKLIRKIRNGIFGFSLLFMALGVFLIVEPNVSRIIICYIFGALIVACGVIDLVNYKVNKKQRNYFRFDLVKGILILFLGLFIIISPVVISRILPSIFGLVLLLDGITKVMSSFDIKLGRDKSWAPIMCVGTLICILGILIIINPFVLWNLPINFLMIVIGISLICDGASNIWCMFCLKKHIKENS